MTGWKPLGSVAPPALGPTRIELHWAVAAVEQVGKALVPKAEDLRHLALRWDEGLEALVTAPVKTGARAALRPATASLLALDADGRTVEGWVLTRRKLVEALAWVRARFTALTGEKPDWPALRDDLPASPLAEGGSFSAAGPAHHELARWFADAAAVLEPVAAEHDPAGPVLCWPHHFDIATRLDFEPEADPEQARSVGLGLSPGDGDLSEPYFYVLPWPEPDAGGLRALDGPGEAVTEGFVGWRLPGSDLVALDGSAQEEAARRFLREGLSAAKGALGL
ncbi:MAG: hypothetical protein R3266_01235 [Gemmatimonadota bacterium]|nr:hypothetical protein [Gemmatimonadota bacterium]